MARSISPAEDLLATKDQATSGSAHTGTAEDANAPTPPNFEEPANHALAQAIGDQGWGELARQLGYKTVRHGGQLLVAGRWFASSKTCSACGAVRPKLTLAERTYRCDACGLVCGRDVNAAANLAAWGEHELGLCACSAIQVGDRHPGGPSGTGRSHACGGRASAATELVATVPSDEAGTSQPRVSVA